tara:strand:- start:243 stop:566 length:324 start_codon:yes stop_codon:yes gene_type:complete
MLRHKNKVSCDIWNDLVIEKQNEIDELESDLYNINQIIIDEYLETRNENIRPELNEQYKEIDDKLQDAKRGYEYIKLLDKWLDKKVKPNKNFYKNMKIYDELKRSVM